MKDIQAFPLQATEDYTGQVGMSLRDYFAAHAMQGLLGSLGEWTASTPNLPFADTVACDAYWIADAMLEAREKVREDD